MANWRKLPDEVGLMIWGILTSDARKRKNLQQYRRTSHAVVCRQWQAVFERLNFRQLILTPACVNDLNRRVPDKKRDMVEHIWLRLEMSKYSCHACQSYSAAHLLQCDDDLVFTGSLVKFFEAMSA